MAGLQVFFFPVLHAAVAQRQGDAPLAAEVGSGLESWGTQWNMVEVLSMSEHGDDGEATASDLQQRGRRPMTNQQRLLSQILGIFLFIYLIPK